MAKVKEQENVAAKADNTANNTDNSNKKKNKKENKDIDGNSKKKKKGKGKIIIFFILFVLILGMIGAILFFNVFNVREKYLRTTIDKIPIVRNIIPKAPTADSTNEQTKTVNVNELEAKIVDLENQIKTKDTTITTLTDSNNDLQLENTRLKEIESQQVQFKQDKADFDKMIATNDPSSYSTFYEKISPENAETLYQQTKQTAEQQKELKKYTDTFETIDAAAGALIMEEMIGTDINLASMILKNIDSEQTAKIVAAMDSTKAASLVKYMAPAQ